MTDAVDLLIVRLQGVIRHPGVALGAGQWASESAASILSLHDHESLSFREHHQLSIDGQAQQAIRPGFAAALISGTDQISEPEQLSCATICLSLPWKF